MTVIGKRQRVNVRQVVETSDPKLDAPKIKAAMIFDLYQNQDAEEKLSSPAYIELENVPPNSSLQIINRSKTPLASFEKGDAITLALTGYDLKTRTGAISFQEDYLNNNDLKHEDLLDIRIVADNGDYSPAIQVELSSQIAKNENLDLFKSFNGGGIRSAYWKNKVSDGNNDYRYWNGSFLNGLNKRFKAAIGMEQDKEIRDAAFEITSEIVTGTGYIEQGVGFCPSYECFARNQMTGDEIKVLNGRQIELEAKDGDYIDIRIEKGYQKKDALYEVVNGKLVETQIQLAESGVFGIDED